MKPHPRPRSLEFQVARDYAAMSRQAADLIITALKQRPNLVLCASAGGTPTGTYQELAARYAREPKLFGRMRVLMIDEWGGLLPGSPASCRADLEAKLVRPLRISSTRWTGFRTEAGDPEAECQRIRSWLTANGPIDVCILGLGANGHIAMNEPSADSAPHAHVARLSPSSLRHGMLEDLRPKPKYGLTLGLADILQSRRILLLVNGEHKRTVLNRLRASSVTSRFPASFLWLHPNATVFCDRAAAGE